MRMGLGVLYALLRSTVQEWAKDNAAQLAAALAFYTFFSLAPLLVIAVSVASLFVDGAQAHDALMVQLRGLVGADGADVVGAVMENLNQERTNPLATALGIVTILFGATGVFAELQYSLNRIWDTHARPVLGPWGFLRTRFLSFAMVLGIGFLLLVSLIVSALLAAFDQYLQYLLPRYEFWLRTFNLILSYGVTTLLFAMIFKLLPDVYIRWSNVWLGAVVTTLLFTLGKSVIGLYLGNSAFSSTYGAAGSVAILLFWVYYSAQILFFGAEFTRAYTLWRQGDAQAPKGGNG
jgi:membrane protein